MGKRPGAVAGWTHALWRHRRGNGGGTVVRAAFRTADVDHGGRADAVPGLRHRDGADRLLPERLLLRASDHVALGRTLSARFIRLARVRSGGGASVPAVFRRGGIRAVRPDVAAAAAAHRSRHAV